MKPSKTIQDIKSQYNLCYDYDKLDFNHPITREHVDQEVYDNKFKFVDKVKQMKKPHPLFMQIINEDKTMKAYYFLRLNNEPIKLFPYQDLILNDTYRFKYFEAANQIGKSISLDVDAVLDFITDHGKEYNIAIVSKTLPQSTHQMRRVKQFLNSMAYMDWKVDKGGTDSMSVIELSWKDKTRKNADGTPKVKYVNRIICCPATEAALGYDLHKEYLDEFEFWDEATYMYDQVLEPRTYGTKGDITVTTNPNGNDTKGAELTRLMLTDNTKKFHVYNFNFLDRPGNTQLELDNAKIGKTRAVVESTLMAIRSISDRNFFTSDEIENSFDKKLHDKREFAMYGKQTFWFLDVGAKHDQSVLVGCYVEPNSLRPEMSDVFISVIQDYPVGYPLSRVIGVQDDNQDSDGWHYVKSVKEYIEENSHGGLMPVLGIDVTGNTGISPLCNAAKLYPIDITFSGPVKSGMFQTFKYHMEKKLIHRIKHTAWEYQAKHLVVKKSQRGYLMIHHETENDLDDCMDATAGVLYLATSPNVIPTTLTII